MKSDMLVKIGGIFGNPQRIFPFKQSFQNLLYSFKYIQKYIVSFCCFI